jgi:hypothetical protein
MEYFLKDLIEPLMKQRETLIFELSSLNENLPNYGLKTAELNTQIMNIDNNIRDYVYSLKDLENQKQNNELAIKTQLNK